MQRIIIRYDIGNSENYPELVVSNTRYEDPQIVVESEVTYQYKVGFVSFGDGTIIPVKEIRRINWFVMEE